MSESPFIALINLVNFDQGLLLIENSITDLHNKIASFKNKIEFLQKDLESTRVQFNRLRKEVDTQELQMKELEQQEKQHVSRLENIHNHKEYQSIKKEIELLKKKQFDNEEALISVWNKFEIIQTAFKAKKKFTQNEVQKLLDEADVSSKKIIELKKELEGQSGLRVAKEKKVPDEWIEKYSMMRSRVTNPVVKVVNRNCGACFFEIRQQDMLDLERRKLLQCRECYRFLYIESSRK